MFDKCLSSIKRCIIIKRYNILFNSLIESKDKKNKIIKDEKDVITKVRSYFDGNLITIKDVKYKRKLLTLDLNKESRSNMPAFLGIFYAIFIAVFLSYVSSLMSYFYQVNSYEFQLMMNGVNNVSSKVDKTQPDVKKEIQEIKKYSNDFKNESKTILDIYSFSRKNPYFFMSGVLFIGLFFHYIIDNHESWKYDTKKAFILLCIDELEEKEKILEIKEVKEALEASKKEDFERINKIINKKNVININDFPMMVQTVVGLVIKILKKYNK